MGEAAQAFCRSCGGTTFKWWFGTRYEGKGAYYAQCASCDGWHVDWQGWPPAAGKQKPNVNRNRALAKRKHEPRHVVSAPRRT